jgi:hypothetical protein
MCRLLGFRSLFVHGLVRAHGICLAGSCGTPQSECKGCIPYSVGNRQVHSKVKLPGGHWLLVRLIQNEQSSYRASQSSGQKCEQIKVWKPKPKPSFLYRVILTMAVGGFDCLRGSLELVFVSLVVLHG